MGYYKISIEKTPKDGKKIRSVEPISSQVYQKAVNKESIQYSEKLGGKETTIKGGHRSISPNGVSQIVWVASPSLVPEYLKKVIKEYEERDRSCINV